VARALGNLEKNSWERALHRERERERERDADADGRKKEEKPKEVIKNECIREQAPHVKLHYLQMDEKSILPFI
jgi:hypothetical protein